MPTGSSSTCPPNITVPALVRPLPILLKPEAMPPAFVLSAAASAASFAAASIASFAAASIASTSFAAFFAVFAFAFAASAVNSSADWGSQVTTASIAP